MHKYQRLILQRLLFNKGIRFSDLNNLRIGSDRFNFHLKKLIENGLVIKKENLYSLSAKGKEFANRAEKQAKLGVALNIYKNDGDSRKYLIQKRSKEPFTDWYGTPSGKIEYGENPLVASIRILKKETGLIGDINLKGIAHHVRSLQGGVVVEDEYFWVFSVTNIKGKLMKHPKGGENAWMGKKELKKLKSVFATYSEMEKFTNSKELLYLDIEKIVSEY